MTLGVLSCHEHWAQGQQLLWRDCIHCIRQKRGKEEQELHRQVRGQTSKYASCILMRKMETLEESQMLFVTNWGHSKMESKRVGLRPSSCPQCWQGGGRVATWLSCTQPASAVTAGEEKQLLVSHSAISIPPCLTCHGRGSQTWLVCAVLAEKKEILHCLCCKMMILS